jgi:hypothetical protein
MPELNLSQHQHRPHPNTAWHANPLAVLQRRLNGLLICDIYPCQYPPVLEVEKLASMHRIAVPPALGGGIIIRHIYNKSGAEQFYLVQGVTQRRYVISGKRGVSNGIAVAICAILKDLTVQQEQSAS